MHAFVSTNPATGSVIKRYALHSSEEVDACLKQATRAFEVFSALSIAERGTFFRRLAALLDARIESLGKLMTSEMGKPIAQARSEIQKCAHTCRYYADHAADFLAPENVGTEARRSFVDFEPLGPILAIMPWNFPFWQVFRFAAPGLMAGNVALLKHAPNVPQCAEAIESLFLEAGFPQGCLQHLFIDLDTTGRVLRDRRVQAVTLTGSSRAGKAVAQIAGSVLKKAVLELGGTDAFIVLADADLDEALAVGLKSRMQNNGQSCIAAKRFILDQSIADAFTRRFVDLAANLTVGDPLQEATDLGPLARQDLRDRLHDQVTRSVEAGARVLTGGTPVDGPGFYYPPTVLADAKPGIPAFDEELFGPVAALCTVRDEDEALAFANESTYGLGGTIFTKDHARGERLARKLQAGCAFVNAMVRSDPRLPFGGVKESGLGRELSHFGIREFVNIKTVWVE